MTKRMLIDTTHAEETRVVVLDGNRLEDYDVETSAKKQLKGNIYLAKVVRIEPSLQAAFVEYGGNRHGFLAFSEIHPDYYQIPVADREKLIALQEEEARAEEARAEREDEEAERAAAGGHDAASDGVGPDDFGPGASDEPYSGDSRVVALATHAEAVHGEPEGVDADEAPHGGFDRDGGEANGARQQDAGTEESGDQESGEQGSEEASPEEGGAEDSDDGRAQRRTARFLRQYKIQEVIRRRQILLIQVVKEERGNKGAALTTYISLAGRFCVLMPNTLRGGGVSRKITSAADRRRLKEITSELDIPRGMAMIVRTAGAQRPSPEIKRDCEYLLRLWDDIRETTLNSVAPTLVYEEASLIKRAIRDVYTRDVEEIVVDGETGWKSAREFMRMLMPANASKVNLWRDSGQPLFSHYQVEHHLDSMLQPTVQLRSGGYLVINQTEALVAIDVNSGRSTRERGIEETALRTNMEAADEVARQLRLRDLAGLIVIDFIDMESRKHNAMVERRLKDALRNDRARIQVGSISHFGLMEMSRQRLRPSLAESSFVTCPHCAGSGLVRGTESSALHVLRAIEEEGGRRKAAEILVHVATSIALYILNHKRIWLAEIESRHNMIVRLAGDDTLLPPTFKITRVQPQLAPAPLPVAAPAPVAREIPIQQGAPAPSDAEEWDEDGADESEEENGEGRPAAAEGGDAGEGERRRKRRRRRRRGGRRDDETTMPDGAPQPDIAADADADMLPGEEVDLQAPPAPDGEALEGVPAFATDAAGLPAPVEAHAPADAEEGGRRRSRRGGRNRRGQTNGEQPSTDRTGSDRVAEPAPARAYTGPTPANPFAGSFDIFEMIERDAEEVQQLAPNPGASAASYAPQVPAAPAPVEEEAPAPAPQTDATPVATTAEPAEIAPSASATPDAAPASPAPEETGSPDAPVEDAAAVEAATGEAATGEAASADEAAPKRARARTARVAKPKVAKEPKAAKAPKEPKDPKEPKAPRASRSRKKAEPAEGTATDTPPAEGATDAAIPAPVTPVPVTAASDPAPKAAEPEAVATDAADTSIVQPVIIDENTAPAKRRTGWWKR